MRHRILGDMRPTNRWLTPGKCHDCIKGGHASKEISFNIIANTLMSSQSEEDTLVMWAYTAASCNWPVDHRYQLLVLCFGSCRADHHEDMHPFAPWAHDIITNVVIAIRGDLSSNIDRDVLGLTLFEISFDKWLNIDKNEGKYVFSKRYFAPQQLVTQLNRATCLHVQSRALGLSACTPDDSECKRWSADSARMFPVSLFAGR